MSWPRLADLSRLPLPGMDHPGSVRFTPDGSALTYLQAEPGSLVASLWRHDLATGQRTVLVAAPPERDSDQRLSTAEQLDRERRRTSALGVTEYAWLPLAPQPTLMVPIGGRLLVAVGDETLVGARPLTAVDEATAVAGAPDGSRVAFVRGGDVWTASLVGGEPRRLTADAEDGVFSGRAEYVAAEELGRHDGMWWSTDGRHLAFARVDERAVPPFVIGHLGDGSPGHEQHRYPFAGGPNAMVTLRIADPDGASSPRHVPLPMRPDDYLARVIAHPHHGWLAAVLRRGQRELDWFRVETDASVTALWTETGNPWLNLDDDTRILADGRVLRTSERTGFRHLELRSADGASFTPLTEGDWTVTSVVHADAERDEAWFLSTAAGVTERHLHRVSLSAPSPVQVADRITIEAGWHDIVFSQDGTRWADTWSDLDAAPRLVVHERGREAAPRVIAPASASADELDLRPPELLSLMAADGETPIHAALYRPTIAEAGPPPCVVWVYGGPHARYVKRSWELTAHPLRQYLAGAGAAVLVVDGRGSADRGLAFESVIRGRLGHEEVRDQAAAVEQLAERGVIDPARVAITGGSYGGFMTLRAMALQPTVFRVGVAIAPVTDWIGYDTAYTERYLGLPDEHPAAYVDSSALALADRIQGNLLIIHGAIDENVHLRHSVRLVGALQAAGRDVELVILPSDRHRVRTATGMRTRDRRTVRHLLNGLGLPLPDELRRD